MQIIAHRGASFNYPENTQEAFLGAIAMGVSAVETDLRGCADGSLVLCHDAVLKSHEGPMIRVASHSLPHIRKNAIIGPGLMDLDSLISLLRRSGCSLHLEIKPGHGQVDIVEKAAAKLALSEVKGLISSFDPLIVERASQAGAATLLLMDTLPIDAASRAEACGASFLGINIRAIWGAKAACIARKIPVYAFTVNTIAQLRRCVEAGLAGVYSDHPDLLAMLRQQVKGRYDLPLWSRRKADLGALDAAQGQGE